MSYLFSPNYTTGFAEALSAIVVSSMPGASSSRLPLGPTHEHTHRPHAYIPTASVCTRHSTVWSESLHYECVCVCVLPTMWTYGIYEIVCINLSVDHCFLCWCNWTSLQLREDWCVNHAEIISLLRAVLAFDWIIIPLSPLAPLCTSPSLVYNPPPIALSLMCHLQRSLSQLGWATCPQICFPREFVCVGWTVLSSTAPSPLCPLPHSPRLLSLH